MASLNAYTLRTLVAVAAIGIAFSANSRPFDRGQGAVGPLNGAGQGPSAEGLFDRIDADDDGYLTVDEMVSSRMLRVERRFDRADSNDDGSIDFDEFSARRSERHNFIEENEEELRACVEEALGEEVDTELLTLEEAFAEKDTNGDGGIDLSEAEAYTSAKITERFNEIDENGDGLADLEEFTASLEAAKERRQAIRDCVAQIKEQEEDLEDLTADSSLKSLPL